MALGDLIFGQGGGQSPQAEAPQTPPVLEGQPPQELSFTEKLRSDPALMQSMLMMGARLMQGPRPGQDVIGSIGDAMVVGSTTHNMMKENERKAALEEQEMARRNTLADAQIGQTKANTEQTQLETSQKKESFPQTQAKAAEEIRRLRAAGDLDSAKLVQEKFKSDPARMAAEWGLDQAKTRASIAASNASAGASAASAEASRANAGLTGEKLKAAKTLNEEGQASSVLHGSAKGGASGARQKMEEMDTFMKEAYPEMPVTERKKKVARMFDPSKMKGEDLQTLRTLADNGNDAQREFALARLEEAVRGGVDVPPPAAPAQAAAPAWGGQKTRLPPKDQLVKGQVYNGLQWTGTGFIPVGR